MKKQKTATKSNQTTSTFKALARLIQAAFTVVLLPVVLLLLTIQTSHAGSATWKASPATGDWGTATNWTPSTVPNGPIDTANFATSNRTAVSLSASTEVNGIVFNTGASAFTITVADFLTITVSGVGITNNSGITQNFVGGNGSRLDFFNNATAGSGTIFTNNGGTFQGSTEFFGTSTADNGTFINNNGGRTSFYDTSTAGNGVFTSNGGTNGTFVGEIDFFGASTAGNGTFTINGSDGFGGAGFMFFGGVVGDSPSAGNATIIANGGTGGGAGGSIIFSATSLGGTARVEVFGNGTGDSTNGKLDIGNRDLPGVTIGSIEGNGLVFLSDRKLTVGSNNLSTTFSGVISDGGSGASGSVTKTGKGKLTLSKASSYTGGTTVSAGTLLATNKTGSATGTGAVQVSAGTLGGTGKITGAVTVASGTKAAFLAPGSGKKPGTLTILSALTLNSPATYKADLNSTTVLADKVVALGVTIISGALISIGDLGSAVLAQGTVFTVISNSAATPIAGTFSNLADGSTLTVGSNNYQVSYEGGTGNDLTLTVVP